MIHTLDRYRIHHPDAEAADVDAAFNAGSDVDPAVAAAVLGRTPHPGRPDRYRRSPDGRGLFVVDGSSGYLITYLRLQPSQIRRLDPAPARPAGDWPKAAGRAAILRAAKRAMDDRVRWGIQMPTTADAVVIGTADGDGWVAVRLDDGSVGYGISQEVAIICALLVGPSFGLP